MEHLAAYSAGRYHDLCEPSDVPEAVEKAFHDYEHSCEDHFCNAIGSTYDGTKSRRALALAVTIPLSRYWSSSFTSSAGQFWLDRCG